MDDKIKFIRSLVRPIITWAIVAVILAIGLFLAWRFANQGMADKAVDSLITMGGMIVAFWFGSRIPTNPSGDGK